MPDWASRIVGHGEVSPTALAPHPLNWRMHPRDQRDQMSRVLDEVGWVQDVIVNKRTGNMLDGHMRVQLAKDRGESTVPVVYVDLSEQEEAQVLITFDPLSAMAKANLDNLNALKELVDQPPTPPEPPTVKKFDTTVPLAKAWVLIGVDISHYGLIDHYVREMSAMDDVMVEMSITPDDPIDDD